WCPDLPTGRARPPTTGPGPPSRRERSVDRHGRDADVRGLAALPRPGPVRPGHHRHLGHAGRAGGGCFARPRGRRPCGGRPAGGPPVVAAGGLALVRVDGVPLGRAALRHARWRYGTARGYTGYQAGVVLDQPRAFQLPGVLAPTRLLSAQDNFGGEYGLVWD